MKQKTAMMELIDAIQEAIDYDSKSGFYNTDALLIVKEMAEERLEKEKEQIIDFGINCAFYGAKNPNQSVSEGINDLNEKFNETYKQD